MSTYELPAVFCPGCRAWHFEKDIHAGRGRWRGEHPDARYCERGHCLPDWPARRYVTLPAAKQDAA